MKMQPNYYRCMQGKENNSNRERGQKLLERDGMNKLCKETQEGRNKLKRKKQ